MLRRIPELMDKNPAMADVLQEIGLECMVTMHSAIQTLDTLLVMAPICGNIALIQQIFDKRPWDLASFMACGNCNMSPLRWAAHQGHLDAVALLPAHDFEPIPRSGGPSPLEGAVRRGHTEIARLLVEKGAGLDNPNYGPCTIMFILEEAAVSSSLFHAFG